MVPAHSQLVLILNWHNAGNTNSDNPLHQEVGLKFLLAYLDPSNGSFIVQAVVGAVLGVSFFARTHIKALLGRFKNPASGKSDVKKKSQINENE